MKKDEKYFHCSAVYKPNEIKSIVELNTTDIFMEVCEPLLSSSYLLSALVLSSKMLLGKTLLSSYFVK